MHKNTTSGGYHVGKARVSFRELELDEYEKNNLKQQGELIRQIVVLQDEVVDLAAAEELTVARSILADQLMAFDVQFDRIVENMQNYQRQQINHASEMASDSVQEAIIYSISIAVFGILLTILIALIIRRHIIKQSAMMADQVTELDTAHGRINELLHSILPADIVRRIQAGEIHIVDKHNFACIVFCDMVGFTALSARLQPSELVRILDRLFVLFDEQAKLHNMEKIKTIGDAYMAVSGLNREPKAIQNAAYFSLGLIQCAKQLSTELNIDINVRVGMHVGPIIAGVIGGQKPVFDCWGNTVNMAARMEQSGEAGKVHVTNEVKQVLHDEFNLIAAGNRELKGIGNVNTWLLAEAA